MKNGKKPLSEKKEFKVLTADQVFGGANDLPPDVEEDMKARKLVPRWLNAKQVYANQGYHKKGWEVYRRPKNTQILSDFKTGQDPDGVIRRGDLILGFKTQEKHLVHKAFLAQQARALSGSVKNQKKELQAAAQDLGLDTQVEEGYDGDDDED